MATIWNICECSNKQNPSPSSIHYILYTILTYTFSAINVNILVAYYYECSGIVALYTGFWDYILQEKLLLTLNIFFIYSNCCYHRSLMILTGNGFFNAICYGQAVAPMIKKVQTQ